MKTRQFVVKSNKCAPRLHMGDVRGVLFVLQLNLLNMWKGLLVKMVAT